MIWPDCGWQGNEEATDTGTEKLGSSRIWWGGTNYSSSWEPQLVYYVQHREEKLANLSRGCLYWAVSCWKQQAGRSCRIFSFVLFCFFTYWPIFSPYLYLDQRKKALPFAWVWSIGSLTQEHTLLLGLYLFFTHSVMAPSALHLPDFQFPFVLRQDLAIEPQLPWGRLCDTIWPQIPDDPASVSCFLGLWVRITTCSPSLEFLLLPNS